MGRAVALRSLDLVLTPQCNLRCEYCYQNAKGPGSMAWPVARAGLDLLLRHGRERVSLSFYGGEPLLELPTIRRAVAYVERRRGTRNVRYVVSTNGLLLDDDAIAFLARHGVQTQISFDGVAAAQARRGAHTHATLDARLRHLRRRWPLFLARNVRVAMTVTGATVPHLADSVAYLSDLGVREIAAAPVFHHDPTWEVDAIAALDAQFERVRRDAEVRFARTLEVPFAALRRSAGPPVKMPRHRAMCGMASGEQLTVDVDGRVGGCVTLAESYQRFASPFLAERVGGLRLGHVTDRGLPRRLRQFPERAHAAAIFTDKQDKYSSYGRCGACPRLAECVVCPVAIAHIPGNTDPRRVPDLPCAFERVSARHRAQFPAIPSPFELLRGTAREVRA